MSALEIRLRTVAGCCGYRYAPYRVVPYDGHAMAAVPECLLLRDPLTPWCMRFFNLCVDVGSHTPSGRRILMLAGLVARAFVSCLSDSP